MITIAASALDLVEADLTPDILLGASSGSLGHRLTLGGPNVVALSPLALASDPDLAAYVSNSGYDFYLARMTLSLAAAPNAHILNGFAAIRLSGAGENPVAWSMDPLSRDSPPLTVSSTTSTEISLGPYVKISGTRKSEKTEAEWYLYALGELETMPEWRLQRTSTREPTGIHDLSLVVRVRAGQHAQGQIHIGAMISTGRRPFQTTASLPSVRRRFALSA